VPGLSYAWSRDETTLHITYDNPVGTETGESSPAFFPMAASRLIQPRSFRMLRTTMSRGSARYQVSTSLGKKGGITRTT
jgi:hypothetical protein